MSRTRLSVIIAAVASALVAACGTSAPEYTPTSTQPPPPQSRPFADLLTELDDPVDILVVGDGSGPSTGSWVYLTMQEFAVKNGRQGLVRDWNFPALAGYVDPPAAEIPGDGAPITVWNASLSRNIEFLNESLDGMRPPADVDLVLVNNGSDMGPNTLAEESIPFLRRLTEQYPHAAVVTVLQPNSPFPSEQADWLRGNVRDLAVSCRINGLDTIDVAAVFDGATGVYEDGARYPNADGQRLWSSTVTDALLWDIDVPAS